MSEATFSCEFFVRGEPKGQPRARAFALKRGGQTFVRMYTPGSAESWKNEIAIAARPHLPLHPLLGPIALDLEFYFERPKAHYRTGRNAGVLREDAPYWHTSKPDRDNLEKAVMDALTTLGFFKDDAQVCGGDRPPVKVYGDVAGCNIRIAQLEHARVMAFASPEQPELLKA